LHPQNQNSWLFNALAVQQRPRLDQHENHPQGPPNPEGGHTSQPGGYHMPENPNMYQNPASFLIQRLHQHVQGHPIQGLPVPYPAPPPKIKTIEFRGFKMQSEQGIV
jgi:hypothetical protein